jgi:hypothetical protein
VFNVIPDRIGNLFFVARSHVLRGNVSLDALRRIDRLFYVLVCSLMITIRVGGMDKLVCPCKLYPPLFVNL